MDDELLAPVSGDSAQARGSVRAALRFAGARVCTVDDHMFRIDNGSGVPWSFRVQLFTGEGLRPVAVVTQTMDEGASLMNAAERYAAAVWERLCPGEELPPLWVQRQLLGPSPALPEEFELVTFGEAEPYRLRKPRWRAISPSQLAELVGGPVAEDRGEGYMPRELPPGPESRFEVFAVRQLGQPSPFRAPGCMPEDGVSWWRRWWRQAVPSRRVRDCCWYHGGDWHAVSRMALRFLAEGVEAGVEAEDMAQFVDRRAEEAGADVWQREALDSLFSLGVAITPDGSGGFVNGQHRAQAMLSAGVRRTVVVRDVWPEEA
ncbi:hypothetical protein ACFWNL_18435 [Kitasatospora sp. NPDC058397]|uniref:hypothetical protein n=1 Tax=unclassified Kitasatospora TaxID=2633591 RepID=UPI003656FB10